MDKLFGSKPQSFPARSLHSQFQPTCPVSEDLQRRCDAIVRPSKQGIIRQRGTARRRPIAKTCGKMSINAVTCKGSFVATIDARSAFLSRAFDCNRSLNCLSKSDVQLRFACMHALQYEYSNVRARIRVSVWTFSRCAFRGCFWVQHSQVQGIQTEEAYLERCPPLAIPGALQKN